MSKQNTNKITCPIDSTHRRHNDALLALREAITSYQDPTKFIASLNTTIQTLRNVTFILQSEKNVIPNFDAWYSRWQESMRGDEIMKWSVEARNRVVKQGDLETKSMAIVTVLTHEDHEVLELSFEPFSKLEDIANGVIKYELIKLPSRITKEGVLQFERKWVIEEFPKAELLDLLIYCYNFLLNLVKHAHEQLNTDFFMCKNNFWNKSEFSRILYILHDEAKEHRFLRMRCSDHSIITTYRTVLDRSSLVTKDGDLENSIRDRVEERYGSIKDLDPGLDLPQNELFPFNKAGFYIGMAKRSLKVDKVLYPLAFLFTGESPGSMVSLMPEDRPELYVSMQHLADMVEIYEADSVIISTETWTLPSDDPEAHLLRPSEAKNKREAILIAIATPKRTSQYIVPFKRSDGEIIFGKTQFVKEGDLPMLTRIYRLWSSLGG